MRFSNRAEVATTILIILAVVGLGAWLFKPKALSGESRRAKASATATANLEEAAKKAAAVEKQRSAVAAASVVEIGRSVAAMPDSKEKDFATREIPVALANLEAPDSKALLEAERRHSAILEGRLQEASKLYGKALEQAETLQKERDGLVGALEKSFADRRLADAAINEAAAANLALTRQRNQLVFVAAVLIVGWLWVKFTHTSPGALARTVGDIRGGIDPIAALDGATTRFEQWLIRLHSKFTKPPS